MVCGLKLTHFHICTTRWHHGHHTICVILLSICHKQKLITEMWQIIAKSQGKGGPDKKTVKDLEAKADDESAMGHVKRAETAK